MLRLVLDSVLCIVFFGHLCKGGKLLDDDTSDFFSTTPTIEKSISSSSGRSSSSESFEEKDSPKPLPVDRDWELMKSSADLVLKYSKLMDKSDKKCASGEYMSMLLSGCIPCSQCGPELYVRRECLPNKDTLCDWCFNKFALINDDFNTKCDPLILQRVAEYVQMQDSESSSNQQEPFFFSPTRIDQNYWWKIEMAVEACFFLLIAVLIISIIRFLSKGKKSYKTVNIHAPILDEFDQKEIIKAADSIRDKLGKKGYERLEEFI